MSTPWHTGVAEAIRAAASEAANTLSAVVFYAPRIGTAEIPLIVVWLLAGGVYFTLYLRFLNIRGFSHALSLVRKSRQRTGAVGEITAFQALSAALSGTIGLGNIAGVAVAISIGGPGAALWMIVAGFLGMSTKFVECSLAVKYRVVHADGTVSGGPMYYLSRGLAGRGFPKTGRILAIISAVAFIPASLSLFQVNQAYAQVAHSTGIDAPLAFGIAMAVMVGMVIVGEIKTIARVASYLVPFMCVFYILACTIVLLVNISEVPAALHLILRDAFTGEAAAGGFLGCLIAGVRRATYSNEAGLGSSAVAHAAVRTDNPMTEGFVGLLEPFVDTIVICTMTALVIVVTGMHQHSSLAGIELTSLAFESVAGWFRHLLAVAVVLFAYSTIISWFYYGLKAFAYLGGAPGPATLAYKMCFCLLLIVGSVVPLPEMIELADAMNFVLAVPNLIGLYLLAPEVRHDLHVYLQALRRPVAPVAANATE
jgi:alanine or glycine:cation symporter, AGCS family